MTEHPRAEVDGPELRVVASHDNCGDARVKAPGNHGAFRRAEDTARSAKLTALWDRNWSRADPLGYELRIAYDSQWVRFHSLPDSKRYAETRAEYDEILRRHRIVLDELLGGAESTGLQVIAADWSWSDVAAGWSKRLLPGAWPWHTSEPDDDGTGQHFFWASTGLSDLQIDALLLAAADDRCRFLIGAPDLEWLYCPYDGGADVLLSSATERDAIRARHHDWLSSHPGGL